MGENPLTRLNNNLEQSAINENSLIKIQIELFDRLRKKVAKEKGKKLNNTLKLKLFSIIRKYKIMIIKYQRM